MREQLFEMRVFPADENGRMETADEFAITETCSINAARHKAGRLAKKHNGPVDLAYGYEPGGVAQDWNDRYITTAKPSIFTASGYEFERLD